MHGKEDRLIRGVALGGKVRVFGALSTGLVEEIRRRHDLLPTAAAAVGRTVTGAAMMGFMLKDGQRLTVQIKGDGPIGQIVADADSEGHARAYADNPHVHLPSNAAGKLDVAGAVGRQGMVYVIKDLGLKEPYRGASPIVSGEIAEDLTYYFASSEQTPSVVALGVLVDTDLSVRAAGGFILQVMPGLSDGELDELEARLGRLSSVTSLIEQGLGPEDIAGRLVDDLQVLDEIPLRFRCTCSRERVENTLVSLGREEVESLIREKGGAEVVCHFCNEKYRFDRTELETMVREHF
jgi:molecular chaperone Hsp33